MVNSFQFTRSARLSLVYQRRKGLARISHQPGIDMSVDAANKSVHATSGSGGATEQPCAGRVVFLS